MWRQKEHIGSSLQLRIFQHNAHGSRRRHDKTSKCTLALGKPTKFLICLRTFLYYLPIWWIVMLGSISCDKSPSIFNTDSFTPCLHIVCIWARNFNKPNQFSKDSIESLSGDAIVSRLKQKRFILQRQAFFHISVGCCICRLDIKSHFKSWIQQITRDKLRLPIGSACQTSQEIKWICIQVDCWIHATVPEPIAARFGRPLIVECLIKCQAWLHQNQEQNAIHLSVDCWIQAIASEQVMLRFPVGSACQMSLTWVRVCFLIGGACQVS